MRRLMSLLVLVSLTICLVQTNVYAADISIFWNQQPENVRNYLTRMGTTIEVVDNVPYYAEGRYTLGLTSMSGTPDNVTGIKIYVKRGFEDMLTHEIGHCVSNYGNVAHYWDQTPAFLQIWMLEAPGSGIKEFWGYDISTPIEYFAVSYDMYFKYKDYLKKKCPETYKYIDTVIKNTI